MELLTRLQDNLLNLSTLAHDHYLELGEESYEEDGFLLQQFDGSSPLNQASPSFQSASDRFFTLPTIFEHPHQSQTFSRSFSPFPPPLAPLPATPHRGSCATSPSSTPYSPSQSSRFSSTNSSASSDSHSYQKNLAQQSYSKLNRRNLHHLNAGFSSESEEMNEFPQDPPGSDIDRGDVSGLDWDDDHSEISSTLESYLNLVSIIRDEPRLTIRRPVVL